MPRPRKNNADYFSHDKGMRDDPKIKAIRQRFGSDGYAAWCMLLETLTDADNFEIEYNELEVELMSGDFGIDAERLQEIVASFRRLKLISIEGEKLFCPKLVHRMQGLLDDRERKRQWSEQKKPGNKEFSTSKTELFQSETHQSKVKESKVKESKGEIENAHAENETEPLQKTKKNPPPGSAPPPPSDGWRPVDIDAELSEIKTDDLCKERFVRQCQIPIDRYETFVANFSLKVRTEKKPYSNRADFRSHFFNWSRTEFEHEQKQKSASPTAGPPQRATIVHYQNGREALKEKQKF